MAQGESNFIQMNEVDAKAVGLTTGDRAKLIFPEGRSLTGIVQADQSTARETIVVGHGYGHTAMGAQDIIIDGKVVQGIAARGRGISTNAMSANDPTRKGASLLRDQMVGATARHAIPVAIAKI